MQRAILALILAVASAPMTAQQPSAIQPSGRTAGPDSSATGTARAAAPQVEAAETARVELSRSARDSIRELIDRFRRDPEAVSLPSTERIEMGGLTVAAGTHVEGPVAAAGGPLHVFGTV